MASKQIYKKSRNPGLVDSWLDGLGYYRKNVAFDETCLFRAVAEQLFACQIYHERVRKECIDYAKNNYEEFKDLLKSREKWFEHIQKLEKHMVVCGTIELNIISKKYNRDVLVFNASKQELKNIIQDGDRDTLLLCLMGEDHYDVVYKKEHIETAGFCQSIVYTALYENVFGINNVSDIVNGMLYDKNLPISQENTALIDEENNNLEETKDFCNNNGPSPVLQNIHAIAPFPFKVAKALDPNIYRNIEYDSWTEVRREMRLGDWYYGDDKLILGTKCNFNDMLNDENYDCYIQSILDQNKCVIYITKLAEKRIVNYSCLSPENGAKPWPLPYRFSKNLVISNNESAPEKNKLQKRRTKDKRRTVSCGEASLNINLNKTVDQNVSAFVGMPLHIQNNNTTPQTNVTQESATETIETRLLHQPEVATCTPDTKTYNWEPQWPQFLSGTPETYAWAPTPTTPQNMFPFNFKPTGFIASAPVTPDVVPYHDYPHQYYYNYHQVETIWNNTETHQENISSNITTSVYEQPQQSQRTNVCSNLTPSTSYPPMFTVTPGTPVIYTTQPAEMSEVIMPTTPIIYAPTTPVENVYVSPAQYIYPPTPPTSWYPPGVNSDGFIFPAGPNSSAQK